MQQSNTLDKTLRVMIVALLALGMLGILGCQNTGSKSAKLANTKRFSSRSLRASRLITPQFPQLFFPDDLHPKLLRLLQL